LEVAVEIAISCSNFLHLSLAETDQSFLLLVFWSVSASGIALASASASAIAFPG